MVELHLSWSREHLKDFLSIAQRELEKPCDFFKLKISLDCCNIHIEDGVIK